MRLPIFFALVSAALVLAQDTSLAEVKKAFDDAHVSTSIEGFPVLITDVD